MAKKNDETEVKEQDTQETVNADVQQVMYIGPSVPRLGLVQNRVYIGNADDVLAPIKDKYPLVMQLVVPVEDSMRARADVNTPGTACYMAAHQIAGGEG
jgi:hypothetical protein